MRSTRMADFEGKIEMNDDKTEGEVNGKFKLSEEELDNVAGGCTPKYNGYPTRESSWQICEWRAEQNPGHLTCYYCPCFSYLPDSERGSYELDGYCTRG